MDVGSPETPVRLGGAPTPAPALDLAVAGERVYVADGLGLEIFDAGDPAAPTLLGSVRTPGRARGVDLSGDLAVVADETQGVEVIDVRDPASPWIVGSTATRFGESNAADVVVRERLAYVTDGARSLGGLRVVDFSLPTTPVVVGTTQDTFGLNTVALERDFAVAADYYFPNAVPIFEIGSLPPSYSGGINFYLAPRYRDDNGMGIAVRDGLIYMVGDRSNYIRFATLGSSDLFIGRYADFSETTNEAEPPAVELSLPAAGSTVRERSYLTLVATATDNVGVASVQFQVDGVPAATVYRAPFRTNFRVPSGVSQLAVAAIASDFAGNRATSESVTVNVVPDEHPTVRLLAPVASTRVVEGNGFFIAADASDDVAVVRVELRVDGILQASAFFPPYRTSYYVPFGSTGVTVTAVAFDSAGQSTTSEPIVVTVDPDRPPTATLLEPVDGTEVVEGGVVRVVVGAEDDFAVASVRFIVDGVEAATDYSPPYEHSFAVPAGAGEMHLSAIASDWIGQDGASPEVTLSVVSDPGTTATGRVVDVTGASVAGAAVVCAGVAGTSGSDGGFSLTGVPTAFGRVSCSASATGAGGEPLAGASPTATPEPGGTTATGDVTVAPQLLYAGAGDPSGFLFSPGRMLVYDAAAESFIPWGDPFDPTGLPGLSFDRMGGLFATTFESSGGELTAATGAAKHPSAAVLAPVYYGLPSSTLLRLDPDTGDTLEVVGTVVEADDGVNVGVLDLTIDPLGSGLLAYGYDNLDGDGLYRIDPVTAEAARIASGFFYDSAAIAIGGDGLVYLLGIEPSFGAALQARAGAGQTVTGASVAVPGEAVLAVFNPGDGAMISVQPVPGWGGDPIGGMVLQPGSGLFLVASHHALFTLDPATLAVALFASPAPPPEGHFAALALRPLFVPPVTTDVTGEVIDADGAPLAGVAVATVGGAGATGADGSFTLPAVRVRTGQVRVAAQLAGAVAISTPTPPVAGGATDVGTLQLGSFTCVTGTLSASGCQVFALASTVTIYVLDPFGGEQPVGPVVPDASGFFCATVRRDQYYLLRKEDLDCCGQPATCEAAIVGSDPSSSGRCGEPAAACEDLGQVNLSCDFFCGGS